jgi:anti-sigma B factor antagonist
VCAEQQHRNPPLQESRQAAPTGLWLSGPGSERALSRGQSLTVTVVPCSADNVLVLQLAGEIDLRTVERLRECLYAHLSAGAYRGIVLDCTEVTFLAACGIGLLVEIVDQARGVQVQIRLLARTRAVLRALAVTGANELVPRAATVADAVALCTI